MDRALDALVGRALARPERNLYGDLGPRCGPCSGLGYHFRPGVSTQRGLELNATSRCACGGSGLDIEAIERADRESLWREIHRIEAKLGMRLTSRYKFPTLKMSRQYWMETIAWAVASGTAIANSAAEAILFPNVVIPANYLQDGRALRIRGAGGYGTTGTPSLIFTMRWGGVSGTVLSKSFTTTTTSGVGGGASMTAMWQFEVLLQTRANGSAGSLFTTGQVTLFTSTAPTAGTVTNYGLPVALASGSTGGTTPVAVTADLTADTGLSFTATWGTANAANSIQGHQYWLESLN